jgi:hypothetical protein
MSIWSRFKANLHQVFFTGEHGAVKQQAGGSEIHAVHERAQIIRLATEVLDGKLGVIEGSWQLNLYLGGFPDAFPHFAVLFDDRQLQEIIPVFGEVRSACDRFYPLPGSPDRHLWSAEVVAKKDRDREIYEAMAYPQVTEACRKIVTWLNPAHGSN